MTPIDPARVEVYATREEWLAARRLVDLHAARVTVTHRIGASDVASILGVAGAFSTPWETWATKLGHIPPQADDPVLRQGRRWERRVLEDYGEASGAILYSPSDFAADVLRPAQYGEHVLVRHTSEPWAVCSPDGFVFFDDGPDAPCGGVEAKTDQWGRGEWAEETTIVTPGWTGEWPAPAPYVVQCYWSLAVTGLPFWDLACVQFKAGGRLVWHRIMRDEALQAQLLARVAEWRKRHLIRGEAPPVDDSAACSAYVSRHPSSEARRATEEEEALILRMKQHAAAARMEASAAKRIKNELAQRMAGATLRSRWGTVKPPRHVEAPPPAQTRSSLMDTERAADIAAGLYDDTDSLDFTALHMGPSNGKEE